MFETQIKEKSVWSNQCEADWSMWNQFYRILILVPARSAHGYNHLIHIYPGSGNFRQFRQLHGMPEIAVPSTSGHSSNYQQNCRNWFRYFRPNFVSCWKHWKSRFHAFPTVPLICRKCRECWNSTIPVICRNARNTGSVENLQFWSSAGNTRKLPELLKIPRSWIILI